MKPSKVGMKFIVREAAKRMDCSQKDALELLQHFADIVAEQVANGQCVGFKPLGIFAPRTTRQPHKVGIRFRPSITLQKKMAELQSGGVDSVLT